MAEVVDVEFTIRRDGGVRSGYLFAAVAKTREGRHLRSMTDVVPAGLSPAHRRAWGFKRAVGLAGPNVFPDGEITEVDAL